MSHTDEIQDPDPSIVLTLYLDNYEYLREVVQESEGVLQQAQPSEAVLKSCWDDILKALDRYEASWDIYQTLLSKSEDLTAKLREYRAICRNARKTRNMILNKISNLNPAPPIPVPPPQRTLSNPPLPLPKLPEIKIPEFDGSSYQNWPAFWDLFSSLVHDRKDMSKVLKFSILRNCLKGNAFKVIEGLNITNPNYDVAVQTLKDTYHDTSRLSRSLLREFNNLPSPRHKYEELLNFKLSYQKLLLQISNNGIDTEQCDPVITSILTQKLSSETLKLLIDKYKTFDLSLVQISEGLKYALDLFEYCKEQDNSRKFTDFEHKSVKVATVASHSNSVKSKYKSNSTMSQNQNKKSSIGIKPVAHKSCIFCKDEHASKYCIKYSTVESRKQRVKELHLCFSCLQTGHMVSNCKTVVKCRHCDGSHHTFLCYKLVNTSVVNPRKSDDGIQQIVASSQPVSCNQSSSNVVSCAQSGYAPVPTIPVQSKSAPIQSSHDFKLISTALPTATVQVSGAGKRLHTRTFLDTGAQRTFICPSLVQKLNLIPYDRVSLSLSPFGSEPVSVDCDLVKLVVRLGKTRVTVRALVHDNVNTSIRSPGICTVAKTLRQKGVRLADRHLDSDDVGSIGLVIGVDYFHKFVHNQSHALGVNIFSTSGGALIYGPIPQWASPNQSSSLIIANQSVVCARMCISEVESHSVSDLWSLDAVGIKQTEYSPEEKNTVQKLEESIHKVDKQYIVSLPFKSDCRPGTNYRVALGQLYSLMRKLQDNSHLWSHYQSILSDYLTQGFIEVVPSSESIKGYYLPYHHVAKESTTTPIRIVFDASSKKFGTSSLNDCLYTGPSLTMKLFESLLNFRTNPWAVISDISKAFLRIGLDESSRDWCRFVWMTDPSDPSRVVTYRFKVVCFGVTTSPFLLQGTLDFHFRNHPEPMARSLMPCFYVDNFMRSYPSVQQMFSEYPVINSILNDAGMPLQEWVSNNSEFNELVEAENLISVKESEFSVLGILWNIESDTLRIKPCKTNYSCATKRSILSCVSSVFDPLGLVSPIIILGKILVSDLWKANLKWDETVCPEFEERFHKVQDQLLKVSIIDFPRFVVTPSKCQLHVFCDASEKALGAVAYSVDLSSQISNLLVSKARVCPHQKLTIPKLELTSVNIGCKLAHTLMSNSYLKFQSCVIWSDSEVTIARIKSNKCKDTFVRNRVEEIRNLNFPIMYVSSKENPADLVSRGCDVKVLATSSLWKFGPEWLLSQSYPPQKDYLVDIPLSVSVNEITVEPVNVVPTPVVFQIERYCSLIRVKQIILLVLKFITLKTGYQFPLDPLIYLVRLEQQQHYPSLVAYLHNTNLKVSADIKNFASNLDLYIDKDNIIRAKGRIQHANLAESAKLPYLLPPRSHLTTLIIRYFHIMNNHCGVSVLIVLIRALFWIPKGRQIIKTVVKKCVYCKRVCGKPAINPGPPPLPEERVTYVRPYSCTGIDYSGAVGYVDNDVRIEGKAYICLFTCSSTRAVHLELVSSLSASDFLLAFRRFCALFSVPDLIITDNATNFTGFHQFWQQISDEPEVKEYMQNHSVKWKFSVPRSPWKNGFFERLIGVAKGCLAKALYRKVVSYEELRTLLSEFAGVINNRPLTYITEDAEECLTPNHLLYGRTIFLSPPLNTLVDDLPYAENLDLRDQYARLCSVLGKFEKLWNSDYLTALKERHYNSVSNQVCPFKKGDVVLVNLDNHTRKWWPLGYVQELISGPDGVVRSLQVKVGTKIYHRSFNKIVPLEIDTSECLPTPANDAEAESFDLPQPVFPLTPLPRSRPSRRAAVNCNLKRRDLIDQQLL